MSLNTQIGLLHRYLTVETIDSSEKHQSEILQLINSINEAFLNDYGQHRKHIATLLAVYEQNRAKTLSYLIWLIFDCYQKLEKLTVIKFDSNVIDGKLDFEKQIDILYNVTEALLKTGYIEIRLSDNKTIAATPTEKQEIIHCVNRILNTFAEIGTITLEQMQDLALNLMICRNCTKDLSQLEVFYSYASTFLDFLYRADQFQLLRNIAEELLICSYEDDMKEHGYHLSTKAYVATSSTLTACHNAICGLTESIRKGHISDRLYIYWIWELMKLFRNAGLVDSAIQVFRRKPASIQLTDDIKHSITHTYFTYMLTKIDKDLPAAICDYLDENREDIIASGPSGVHAWLNTLLNIEHNYKGKPNVDRCIQYITLFKPIVPQEAIARTVDIFEGKIEAIRARLETALVHLSDTIFTTDFATDNKMARILSDRLIKLAYDQQDPKSYLTSMIVNADYTLTMQDKKTAPISKMQTDTPAFDEIYLTFDELRIFFDSNPDDNFLWLGSNDSWVLPLLYSKGAFVFLKSPYQQAAMLEWYKLNMETLPLEETKVLANGGKLPKEKNDFENEDRQITDSLAFSAIDLPALSNILISKDYELSAWPHNLLVDKSGAMVMKKSKLCNIISNEWLIDKCATKEYLPRHFSKSIWIPTQTGDLVLNWLHHLLHETLTAENFTQSHLAFPDHPVQSDVNIIAAHGNDRINTLSYLYAKGQDKKFAFTDLNEIIGKGKILIFFVCHSGSMRSDFFSNRVNTVMREYLKNGYQAVIAPFWAMDIAIAGHWLPSFMESLNKGLPVIEAVHNGNMAVMKKFPTPKAYACIHLYGNPYFSLEPEDPQSSDTI
jgi:hypothetical protein